MGRTLAIIITLLLLGSGIAGDARRRSSSDVRRESRQNSQRIEQAARELDDNARRVGNQLNRLQSLEAIINLRADSIKALQRRIAALNVRIDSLNDTITRLEHTTTRLKANYGNTLRALRSRRQSMSDVAFIFSARTFSQAWRRLRYLRETARATVRRAAQIKQARIRLDLARLDLAAMRDSIAADVATMHRAQAALDAERTTASGIVADLRRQGRDLNREIERRRARAAALERELQQVIDAEIAEERRRREVEERQRREAEERQRREAEERRRREAAEQQQQPHTATPTPAPPAQPASPPTPPPPPQESVEKLTGSFSANKGKMPFPVAGRYTIVSNFGTNNHPGLSKVQFDNLGIDIEATPGSQARAVFNGTVSSIFRLDGYHNVVIVRHGEYLTVYAGLDRLNVRKGDKVTTGQNIGSIFSDPDDGNRTILHFEIRREKQKLNPVEWVKR